MLCPIHVGNKCSAAAEWPGHQPTLSRLLSHRCPFRRQHDGTDDGMPARRPMPDSACAVPSLFSMTH